MDISFKLVDHRNGQYKGMTHYEGKKRVIIYPHQHETLSDLYATITHELIHYCIERYKMVDMDEFEEHDLIFTTMWAEYYIDE